MVISVKIATGEVTRVFVNNCSSVNVIFFSIFDQLEVNRDLLCNNMEPLVVLGDSLVHLVGEIRVHLKRPFILQCYLGTTISYKDRLDDQSKSASDKVLYPCKNMNNHM